MVVRPATKLDKGLPEPAGPLGPVHTNELYTPVLPEGLACNTTVLPSQTGPSGAGSTFGAFTTTVSVLVPMQPLLSVTDIRYTPADSAEALVLLAEAVDNPEDLDALDAVWNEAMVTFGPDPNAGCPISRDILAKMDIPTHAAAATR